MGKKSGICQGVAVAGSNRKLSLLKSVVVLAVATALMMFVTGCSGSGASNNNKSSESTQTKVSINSSDDLKNVADKDVEDTVNSITEKYNALKGKITSFDAYKGNVEEVKTFYSETLSTQKALNIRLREYSASYASSVLSSSASWEDKYKNMKEIYDLVWTGAGKAAYNGIYDGVLKNAYQDIHDGVLKDAYNTVAYDDWSDTLSSEYKLLSDVKSDAYKDWSDMGYDIYDFVDDMCYETLNKDADRANEKLKKFQEKVDAMK